jgi:serine/threonine protein kinase
MQLLFGAIAACVVLHDNKLVHRDISPNNLLLDANDEVVISDFGSVRHPDDPLLTRSRAQFGTGSYAAPELWPNPANASYPADVFSLGQIAVFLLTGQHPPTNLSSVFELLRGRHLPHDVLRVIDDMRHHKPGHRYANARKALAMLRYELQKWTADQGAAPESNAALALSTYVRISHGARRRYETLKERAAEFQDLRRARRQNVESAAIIQRMLAESDPYFASERPPRREQRDISENGQPATDDSVPTRAGGSSTTRSLGPVEHHVVSSPEAATPSAAANTSNSAARSMLGHRSVLPLGFTLKDERPTPREPIIQPRSFWEPPLAAAPNKPRGNTSTNPARSRGWTLDDVVRGFADGLDEWAHAHRF